MQRITLNLHCNDPKRFYIKANSFTRKTESRVRFIGNNHSFIFESSDNVTTLKPLQACAASLAKMCVKAKIGFETIIEMNGQRLITSKEKNAELWNYKIMATMN